MDQLQIAALNEEIHRLQVKLKLTDERVKSATAEELLMNPLVLELVESLLEISTEPHGSFCNLFLDSQTTSVMNFNKECSCHLKTVERVLKPFQLLDERDSSRETAKEKTK